MLGFGSLRTHLEEQGVMDTEKLECARLTNGDSQVIDRIISP